MPSKPLLSSTAHETEAAFYDALSRADINDLMSLWVDDEEIVCVHPGAPRLIGHSAIRASWEAIFERGALHIRPAFVHAQQNVMMAIHNIIEEVNRSEQDKEKLHIIATNVYVKTAQGWRISAHHASVALGKPENQKAVTAILH